MKKLHLITKKIFTITFLSGFLVVLFLVIMSILGWTMIRYLDVQGRTKIVDALEAVLFSTQKAVHIWVLEHKDDVQYIADSPELLSSIQQQLEYKKNRRSLLNTPALLKMRKIMNDDLHFYEYETFFVISEDFITIGALDDRDVGRENILFQQRPDIMREVFKGETFFIPPLYPVPLSRDLQNKKGIVPSVFIAVPVKDEAGRTLAVLAAGMSSIKGFSFLAQSGRIGKTGEIYFLDKQGRLLSLSRFEPQLEQAGLLRPGQSSILNIEIRDPGGNLLEGFVPLSVREKQPLTVMAGSVVKGQSGKSIQGYNDYRGVKVLGVWLWDDMLRIGMTSEIDETEALESVTRTEVIFLWIMGSIILFSLMLSMILLLIRRQGKQLLKKSESRLFEAQRIAHIGNWVWNINDGTLYWSDEIYRIFGLDPRDFDATYEAFVQIVHPGDREALQEAVNESLQNKTPYGIDHRIIRPDRSERFVHEQGEVYCDDSGKPVQMIGTVQDVTAQKKAEKDLELYREHLEDLVEARTEEIRKLSRVVEQSPNTVIITDKEGTIQFVNPAFCETTGYSFDQVLGENPRILKSDKMENRVYRELWETLTKGKIWKGEFLNKKKDGRLYWDSATISPVKDTSGEISHYVGIQENITARKELADSLKTSEERYRALFEQAGDSIFLVDIDTANIVEFNDQACKNLGYTREEFEKLTIPDFEINGSKGLIAERLEKIRRNGSYTFETKNMRKNKEIRNVMVNNRLISIAGKEYIQSILRDITELKTLEGELRQAKEKAESSARAKSTFLANMSHEIRTPMNSIIGFIELALENEDSGNQKEEFLKTAHNSAVNLLSLLNDILDVSKLDEGKLEIENRKFNLSRLLKETLQSLAHTIGEKELEFSLNMPPDLDHCILADPNRLRQILINLVSNAVKFTDKGFIIVSVFNLENGFLQFSVKDSGIGMTPGQLKKVFQPFTQADESTARRFGGTGLGTTISKQLVTLMGGEIRVESEKGKGTTFYFTLPLFVPDCREKCDPLCTEHGIPGKAGIPISSRSYNILMAEDIEENARLVTVRLTGYDHMVKVVKNGYEAVKAFKDNMFDIILMDIQMPEMDGLEAARQIRKYEADSGRDTPVPIIALTASVMEKERRKCLNAGMNEVVEKPIRFDRLLKLMKMLIPGEEGAGTTTFSIPLDVSDEWIVPDNIQGIDIKKGFKLWEHKTLYIEALKSFVLKYKDVSPRLKRLIEDGRISGAGELSHALKGVSANLSMPDVAELADLINRALEHNSISEAMGYLPALTSKVKMVCTSILGIRLQEEEPAAVPGDLDLLRMEKLISELSGLFSRGEFNQEYFSELTLKLRGYINDDLVQSLKKSVDVFNFKKAREHLETIGRFLSGSKQ